MNLPPLSNIFDESINLYDDTHDDENDEDYEYEQEDSSSNFCETHSVFRAASSNNKLSSQSTKSTANTKARKSRKKASKSKKSKTKNTLTLIGGKLFTTTGQLIQYSRQILSTMNAKVKQIHLNVRCIGMDMICILPVIAIYSEFAQDELAIKGSFNAHNGTWLRKIQASTRLQGNTQRALTDADIPTS